MREVGTTIELLGLYIDTDGREERAAVDGILKGENSNHQRLETRVVLIFLSCIERRDQRERGWSMRRGEERVEERVKRKVPVSWMERERRERWRKREESFLIWTWVELRQ